MIAKMDNDALGVCVVVPISSCIYIYIYKLDTMLVSIIHSHIHFKLFIGFNIYISIKNNNATKYI